MINPLTTIIFYEKCRSMECQGALITAANSSIGKMMIRYFQDNGIGVVGVVRSNQAMEQLK